jgi:hypothetical protein
VAIFEYRCPVHGVVRREQSLMGDPQWHCPQQDDEGHACALRVMIIRCQSSNEVHEREREPR